MDDTLVVAYQCDCRPGFLYKNKQTYQIHLKNDRHQRWQEKHDLQHCREQIVRLEILISSLKVERNMWKDMAIRIKQQYEPINLLD